MRLRDHDACFIDLDGTLLDTEPLHVRAHRIWLASQGIDLPEEAIYGNVGKGDREFYTRLMTEHRVTGATVADWMAAKDEILKGIYRQEGVPSGPGAGDFLDAVEAAGIPCILVTSTIRVLADLALAGAGWADRLPRRITGDDVTRTKPDPESYRLAISRVGCPAARCLAIEDSPVGISAARAAGCQVVALGTMFPEAVQRTAGATHIILDFRELLDSSEVLNG